MPRIRGTRADAQAFVESLKTFSDTLPPEQRAMLGTILDAAQQDETAGYGKRFPRSESDQTIEEDETAGYGRRIPRQRSDGEAEQDETAGYGYRPPRRDSPGQDDDGRWEGLVEWLAREDETTGYQAKYKF